MGFPNKSAVTSRTVIHGGGGRAETTWNVTVAGAESGPRLECVL